MKLEKRIGIVDVYPRGYGFGRYDLVTDQTVCYPLGLNLIISGVRAFYFGVIQGFKSRAESHTYKAGALAGQKRGVIAGYIKGYGDHEHGLENAVLKAEALTKEALDAPSP